MTGLAMNTIGLTLPRPDFTLDIHLRLPAQGITVLFGASGSGKTTVLRCVAGLEKASSALVQIDGEVWQNTDHSLFLPAWRRPVGYVFQEASLFEHLDVQGNLEYGLKRSKHKAHAGHTSGQAALHMAVDLLGIGALLQRRSHQLSGGERQRVAIARALAQQPRMLLLDEPLAALDHARRQEILPWLERLRDELHIPMLYVTHASDEVARLADTLVVLQHGKVKAAGPVTQVLADTKTPVLLGEDMGALLSATVQEIDTQWHLARVVCGGADLWLRDSNLQINQGVRLRVLARDVSISTVEPHHTSIQNRLACVVQSIAPDAHPSQALVTLAWGDAVLLARITARAVNALGLAPGQSVWAQVKSVALVK
jgi:molybdate transport system ATP-binding protein